MFKKLFVIFRRDFLSSTRDAMAIYIIIIPLLLAVAITMFTPGLNDTTVNIAMLDTDKQEHIEFMEQYAKVELFGSMEELERRINKRDDIAGIAKLNNGYEIILQGNENSVVKDYVVALNTFYELGSTKEETTATILTMGKTVPPLKTKLVNMLIAMMVMLAGMLIALSIVEEKTEKTISAVNVSPVSQSGFIIGKTLFGGIISLISIVLSLLITGYYDINWIMIIIVGFTSMLLSLIIGFLQGINSSDVMEASGGVKMLMLPIAGSIAGYEFLSAKWQWTMYWSPFYWAYKANDMILSKTADWGTVILCAGMVLVISILVYAASIPKIRKGLG